DDIGHHLSAKFFGNTGSRDRENTPAGTVDSPDHVLIDNEDSVGIEQITVFVVSHLRHAYQDVRIAHVRVMDHFVRYNQLCAASPATGFRAVGLRKSALQTVYKTSRSPEHLAGKDYALSTQAGYENLSFHFSVTLVLVSSFGLHS